MLEIILSQMALRPLSEVFSQRDEPAEALVTSICGVPGHRREFD